MENRFEKQATVWDEPRRAKMAEKFVGEMFKHIEIQPTWKALELGAGTGLAGLQVLPKVGYMVFEDTSAAMLGVLEEKAKSNANFELLHGEITEYSKQDIDFVFSNMVFHHIEDVDGILKHLYNIMKPGAKLAIADIRTEDGSFHHYEAIPHQGFDTDELSDLFHKNGFSVIVVKTFNVIQKESVPGKIFDYEQFLLIAEK